jgi:outer membrane receptor for ferrienterochelin and colicins
MLKALKTFFIILFVPSVLHAQGLKLTGHVTGADDAVVGATITLVGTSFGTTTDKNGDYNIGKIKSGSYSVRASFVGYETQERNVDILTEDTRLDFSLNETSIDLNEVVVTGTKSEKTLKNVPVITQVITARKMLDLGITNVTDALQTMVPGLNMSQFGTRLSVTMQGMNSKYILFLIDGERIAGEINGDIDYSMLNLENIERIEVIKGASSSLYGSNAIGGVINIITKKINEPFDAKLYSRYSKFNEIYAGGSIGLKKGIIGSRTSMNFSHTDGYDVPGSIDWTQNPYYSFSINQKFEITPSANLSLVPYFTYYQFERGNEGPRPAHDLYIDVNAGLKGQYFFGKNSLEFSYYRDRYNTYSVLERLNNRRDTAAYDIVQTARVQGNLHFTEKHSLTAGLEYNHEDLLSARIEKGLKSADESVVYLQEDLRIGERWNIIAGIRTSIHSNYGFNAAPKLSVMFRQDILNFRASAGTGFRSPALKELYLNFDHFGEFKVLGNPLLKPESSKYISASVEFIRPWNNSSFTIYKNVLSDVIIDHILPLTDSLGLITHQYENVASASVYGFDVISKQKITSALWVSTGYSYVHSLDHETQLQLYGTTKHSGNISADYNLRTKNHSYNAQLYGKLMGKKFYLDPDDGSIVYDKPFTSWRLTLSHEYKWLRISAGLDNIFGLVIPTNIDFTSPGRRFFVGMNVDFGKMK